MPCSSRKLSMLSAFFAIIVCTSLQAVGFGTTRWYVAQTAGLGMTFETSVGLWSASTCGVEVNICRSFEATDSLLDLLNVTRRLETAGLAGLVLTLTFLLTEFLAVNRKTLKVLTAGMCLTAGCCIVTGTVLFWRKIDSSSGLNYSFFLCVASGTLTLICFPALVYDACTSTHWEPLKTLNREPSSQTSQSRSQN